MDFCELKAFLDQLSIGEPLRGATIATERFHNGKLTIFIDTCYVNDLNVFETAIQVNDDEMIIVERYDTKEEAAIAHSRWKNICKNKAFNVRSVQTGKFYTYIA